MSSGPVDEPLEVVRRELPGPVGRVAQRDGRLPPLGEGEVGEVARRLAAPRGREGQLAGGGARGWGSDMVDDCLRCADVRLPGSSVVRRPGPGGTMADEAVEAAGAPATTDRDATTPVCAH